MKNQKEKTSVVKWGSIILFFSLSVSVIFYFFKVKNQLDIGQERIEALENQIQNVAPLDGSNANGEEGKNEWISLVNDEYGYRIKHPPHLNIEDVEEKGSYKSFIRFDENPDYTKERGIAVGVRNTTLSQEVFQIKQEVTAGGEAKLVDEEEFTHQGYDAVGLSFEPLEGAEYYEYLEPKSVVIINNGTYSYSISTVPQQMQKLLDSFEFVVRVR